MRVRVPVYRRFSDLDPLGHVNNVVFIDYLQEGRVGFMRAIGLPVGTVTQVVACIDRESGRPIRLPAELRAAIGTPRLEA